MIFKEPMTSLNPVFTIGMQVMEIILSTRSLESRKRSTGASKCSSWSAFPTRRADEALSRTSSPAGCASA